MIEIVRRHKTALIFAALVGVLAVAPMFVAPLLIGDEYQGIQFYFLADEDIYRARIQEVHDGHWSLASPFLYEYKDAPVLQFPLNEWLYALPAFIFGISATVLVSKFLLPATLFFFVYLLTRKIIGGEDRDTVAVSIAAGLLVTLGIEFTDYSYLLSLVSGAPVRPLLWTRLVNPIVGAVQLFGFLLVLWHVVEGKWRYGYIAAGVLLACMLGYFFAFTLAGAILGVLLLLYIVRREFTVVRELVAALAVFVVCSAPYWYLLFSSLNGGEGTSAAQLAGMEFTHAPVLNKLLLLASAIVAACALYAYRRGTLHEHTRAWLFIGALLLGSWAAFNQQILTGRVIWYHHFVQYTIPLAYVACAGALYLVTRSYLPRLIFLGASFACAVSITYGFYSITTVAPNLSYFRDEQGYAPLMQWLNGNASPDCVVLLKGEEIDRLGKMIAAHTHCNTYTTTVVFAGIPRERILHNYLVDLRLEGMRPEDVRAYALSHEEEVRGAFFTDWGNLYDRGTDTWFLEQVDTLEREYVAFAKKDFLEELQKYRIDYLVVRGELLPSFARSLSAKEVAKTGEYIIYTIGEGLVLQ